MVYFERNKLMPEGRMLKKVVSTSQKLANLKSDSARLLYTWLIPHLDIEGRFSADPKIVKGYVVPRLKMSLRKISEYLEDMAKNDLIVLYEVDGDRYLQLRKFKDFQTLREKRESKSIIPPSTEASRITPGVPTENSSTNKVKESKLNLNKEDKEIFALLKNIKNYPFNQEKDLEFIKGLKAEFPEIDVLEKVKQICANWLNRPLLKKSRPRVQIRRWVFNEDKWQKEGDKARKVGRPHMKEPQFLSMELLNQVYRIIDRKGGDKGKFYDKARSAFPIIRTQWEHSDKKPETFIRLVESVHG